LIEQQIALQKQGALLQEEIVTNSGIKDNATWKILKELYKKELDLIGLEGTYQLCSIMYDTIEYTKKFIDLGHAELLEIYYRKRAELASAHPSPLVKGCFFGMSRILEDLRKWVSHFSGFPINEAEIYKSMPTSIKRALAMRYCMFLNQTMGDKTTADKYVAQMHLFQCMAPNVFESLQFIEGFRCHGKRFKISRPLAKALYNTAPSTNPLEELSHLPFPVVQIELPGPIGDFTWNGEDSKYLHPSVIYLSKISGKLTIKFVSKAAASWGNLYLTDPSNAEYRKVNDPKFQQDILNFAASTIMYINSIHANVVKIPAQERPQKAPKTELQREKLDRLVKYDYYSVGPDFILKNEERTEHSIEREKTFSYKYQFLVRGHFRNQACGPKRLCRRHQWIEPYWKGPDTAEVLARAYVVRDGMRDERDWE
jgi:hypothetical protein